MRPPSSFGQFAAKIPVLQHPRSFHRLGRDQDLCRKEPGLLLQTWPVFLSDLRSTEELYLLLEIVDVLTVSTFSIHTSRQENRICAAGNRAFGVCSGYDDSTARTTGTFSTLIDM